jgi:5-formaminoimidazole-4-carboxamide-1-(beta)-D-ribofuranosyl 5'-monophosphate synthetase
LLERAQINHPKIYNNYSDIEGLAIVKIQESKRKLERAFFIVSSAQDYLEKSQNKIKEKMITKEDLDSSIIEQFVVGTYFNFNFFTSPLTTETEFLGIERRLQTNLNDLNGLPARDQLEFETEVRHIEIGHTPASIRESMLQKVFELGDKFTTAVQKEYPPGLIGPFSLQSIVTPDLEIVVYDVSLRVPGNPIMATTSPYSKYSYGQTFGVGRRIAMEVKKAVASNKLSAVTT